MNCVEYGRLLEIMITYNLGDFCARPQTACTNVTIKRRLRNILCVCSVRT